MECDVIRGNQIYREVYTGTSPHWLRHSLYSQKLELTSPTSGGSSVDIVRLRTQTTEFYTNRFRQISAKLKT
jgi:hypothetical protein